MVVVAFAYSACSVLEAERKAAQADLGKVSTAATELVLDNEVAQSGGATEPALV